MCHIQHPFCEMITTQLFFLLVHYNSTIYWYTSPNTPKRGINTLFFSRHWNAYHKDSPIAISINTPQFHIGFCFDSRCSGCPIDQCKFSKAAPLPNTGGPFTVHINLEEEYIHIYFKIYFMFQFWYVLC